MTEPRPDPRPDPSPGRGPHGEFRDLFAEAVSDVEPTPALEQIRSRTKATTTMREKRPWIFGIAGAAVATAATVVAVTVLTDTGPAETSGPAAAPSAAPTPGEDSPESEPEVTNVPTEPSGVDNDVDEAVVPVYYVGATPTGLRLFREFHPTEVAEGGVLSASTEEVLSSEPFDPDYSSLWSDLEVSASSTLSGGGATIGLTSPTPLASRPTGMSAGKAELAVQQLVYSATAALQRNITVKFEIDDQATDTLLGVDVSGGTGRDDEATTLAAVWVTDPQDGDEAGSTFTVEGQGTFLEANVSWQLLDPSGSVVKDGFATAEQCCVMSPYAFEVKNVSPGDYVLRVYSADVSGGEGNGEPEDTKRVTVR